MDLDIVIYAIVAVAVIARLMSVLGRRNEGEQQRPNPFGAPPSYTKPEDKPVQADEIKEALNGVARLLPLNAAPDSLAGIMQQIKILDPTFDEKAFLQGAKSAFTMIVEDFAKSDMSRITRLLGPDVLPRFQHAIETRRAAGQIMEAKVVSIKEASVETARLVEAKALITVRFVSQQENVLRDANKQVIGGKVGSLEEVTDNWVFERDMKSNDPNWILIETRS